MGSRSIASTSTLASVGRVMLLTVLVALRLNVYS